MRHGSGRRPDGALGGSRGLPARLRLRLRLLAAAHPRAYPALHGTAGGSRPRPGARREVRWQMRVVELPTPGLGDSSWLLAHGGVGVVVDPQRDVDRFLRAAAEAGVELRMVLETHLHNDYVSGALDLAGRSGAELVLPAGTGA